MSQLPKLNNVKELHLCSWNYIGLPSSLIHMHPLTLCHTQVIQSIVTDSPLKPHSTLRFIVKHMVRHYICLCSAPPPRLVNHFSCCDDVSMLRSLPDKTHDKQHWHAKQILTHAFLKHTSPNAIQCPATMFLCTPPRKLYKPYQAFLFFLCLHSLDIRHTWALLTKKYQMPCSLCNWYVFKASFCLALKWAVFFCRHILLHPFQTSWLLEPTIYFLLRKPPPGVDTTYAAAGNRLFKAMLAVNTVPNNLQTAYMCLHNCVKTWIYKG